MAADLTSGYWSARVSGADIVLANEFFRLDRHSRAAVTSEWKSLGYYAAAEHRIPKGLPQCDVISRAIYPTSRPGPCPDTSSWFPMTKAIIDGFVNFGVWPDDRQDCGVRFETFQTAMKSPKVQVPTIVIGLARVRN